MASWKFLSLLAFATIVRTQASSKLSSKGCADSSGLEKCQSAANDATSSCIAQARKDNNQEEILACTCQDYVNNYNCFASHCWNRVWECEYQDYMIGYFQNCLTAKKPVPYFPAPDHVADACSCNLGRVYDTLHDAIQQNTACSNAATQGSDAGSNLQRMEGCSCCAVGGSLEALVGICPETDPKLIGLNSISQVEKNLNVDYPSCGPYMQTFDCVSDLGFQLDGVTTYLRPDDAYKTGTATLSNGGGTVTAPASGAVFTYTNGGDGQVYTITAYGFDGKENKGSSDSGSGSESGSDSGSSSESQSDAKGASASASGDSKKGDDKEDTGSLTSDMHVELLVASIMFAVVCLS